MHCFLYLILFLGAKYLFVNMVHVTPKLIAFSGSLVHVLPQKICTTKNQVK